MSSVDNSCRCADRLERIEQRIERNEHEQRIALERIEQNQHALERIEQNQHEQGIAIRELRGVVESAFSAFRERCAPHSEPATSAVSRTTTTSRGSSATFFTEGGTRVE